MNKFIRVLNKLANHRILRRLNYGWIIQEPITGQKYWTSDFISKTLIN